MNEVCALTNECFELRRKNWNGGKKESQTCFQYLKFWKVYNFRKNRALTSGFPAQTNINEAQMKAPGLDLKFKMCGTGNMELIFGSQVFTSSTITCRLILKDVISDVLNETACFNNKRRNLIAKIFRFWAEYACSGW